MAVVPALLVAATVVSAIGAVKSAQAQRSAADFNGMVANRNAQIATDQGNAQADMQSRQAAMRMSDAVAQYGASGVDTGVGNPVDVLRSSAANATLDNLTLRYNAKVRSYGYGNESQLDALQSRSATQAGYFNAGSSILQGATGMAAYEGRVGGSPSQGAGNAIQMYAP